MTVDAKGLMKVSHGCYLAWRGPWLLAVAASWSRLGKSESSYVHDRWLVGQVVELWAQESRKLCKRPSANGNKKAAEGEPEVANTQDGTEGEAAEERRKQRKKARGKEEEHDALARGREEWALLPASTLDRIGESPPMPDGWAVSCA